MTIKTNADIVCYGRRKGMLFASQRHVSVESTDRDICCVRAKSFTIISNERQNASNGGSPSSDEVAEWLRRWTANPLGIARVGSNPILVALFFTLFT